MIVDGLIMLITGIVQFAYDLLPEWDVTTNFINAMRLDGTGFTALGGYTEGSGSASLFDYMLVWMWQMNKFLPVDHMVGILTVFITFWGALLAYRLAKYLIGVVRGSGTQ